MSWHKHKCFVKMTTGSGLLVDIGQDHGHAVLDADLSVHLGTVIDLGALLWKRLV